MLCWRLCAFDSCGVAIAVLGDNKAALLTTQGRAVEGRRSTTFWNRCLTETETDTRKSHVRGKNPPPLWAPVTNRLLAEV